MQFPDLPTEGSIALAACIALTLFGAWLYRRWERRAKAEANLEARMADLKDAQKAYSDAIRNGTPSEAAAAKRSVDAASRRVQEAARMICLAVLAALCGCLAPREVETVVRLDDHVRIVHPGDTVPDYPAGEARWWLLTPKGLEELLPEGDR